jgi:hypothetical protein
MSDAEQESTVESEPKGVDLTVAIAKMLTGVMQNIEQAVDTKVLVRGEVE